MKNELSDFFLFDSKLQNSSVLGHLLVVIRQKDMKGEICFLNGRLSEKKPEGSSSLFPRVQIFSDFVRFPPTLGP